MHASMIDESFRRWQLGEDASSYHMAFGGIFPLDEMRAWGKKNRDGVLMATCIYKWQLF